MKNSISVVKLSLISTIILLTLSAWIHGRDVVLAFGPDDVIQPKWTLNLPSDPCPGTSDTHCHWGSPVLAHIDGDNFLDIVAVTNKGFVVAVRHNGTVLWQKDMAPHFNMAAGTQEIASSPAVADIDQDGFPEIAVGVGSKTFSPCTTGGLVVLDHNGNLQWKYTAVAENEDPCPNHPDTIYSSPTLADLDGNGFMEVIAGGFDRRIYVWNHNGNLLNGFPPDSEHSLLFPTWPNLRGALVDTIWGSPAVTDLTGDGKLEVLIGTDEGNFGEDQDGNPTGWVCPFPVSNPWDYCGGSVYGLTLEGQLLRHLNSAYNFPRRFFEHIQSTPAIADVNNDGYPEIFVGTGTFYYVTNPAHPTYGFRLFGMDRFGNNLTGWTNGPPPSQGGKVVGGPTPASPTIGDITGDSTPEIIMGVLDEKKLYAYRPDGSLVPGFPMTPRAQNGTAFNSYNVGTSFILGDYDGDGKMEIFVTQGWSVAVIDGNGQQLTATNYPSAQPIFLTDGTIANNPAVGDIDNDGKLELVVTSSKMYVWDLNNSSDEADWPMFKRDAAGTSAYPPPPRILTGPDSLTAFHQTGQSGNAQTNFVIRNTGGAEIDWSVITPSGVSANPSSGTIPIGGMVVVNVIVQVSNTTPPDTYPKGDMTLAATSDEGPVVGGNQTFSVQLIVGDISHSFVPALQK